MNALVYNLENEVLSGNKDVVKDNLLYLNDEVNKILTKDQLDQNDVRELRSLINIFNVIYNNSSDESLLIDDGLYDMLVVRFVDITGESVPGAPQVDFQDFSNAENKQEQRLQPCVRFYDKSEREEKTDIYPQIFNNIDPKNLLIKPEDQWSPAVLFPKEIAKRTHSTEHGDSNLVGTLDKCKFVLVQDAVNARVDLNDPKIKILERDFFGKHIMEGIIDPNKQYTIVISLKYDGCSIEADCNNTVVGARSRGDTGIGLASDMTPILKGYPFRRADPSRKQYGIKFEAIMTYESLYRYNAIRGKSYANCRSAINGLFGASDAGAFRDFITLVPLDMTPDSEVRKIAEEYCPGQSRLADIAFLNTYYTSNGVNFMYAVETGDYKRLLFMVKKFLEEAEYARSYMGFMYDGIVVEYADDDIRERLGRKNYVNQFAMAVKFNPLKKQTHFRGYKYTIGKDGSITPMIYYDPVEFLGTIHPKSSGQSYARFMELGLKIGDIIDVTYTNDVMPYVTRPDNEWNQNNPNPAEQFPKECPVCGAPIRISDSGKSAYCTNPNCGGRKVSRTVDMLDKLGFEGFADKLVTDIDAHTFVELMTIPEDKINLGDADKESFITQRNNLMAREIYDYEFMGALGFTGTATEKWKLICKTYTFDDILLMAEKPELIEYSLVQIKGIGSKTAQIVASEIQQFMPDLIFAKQHMNIKNGKDEGSKLIIRYTGFRNKQLEEQLISMGYDAKDGSVTKSTDILLVPYDGYSEGSKLKKIGPNTKVVPVEEFMEYMDIYLK